MAYKQQKANKIISRGSPIAYSNLNTFEDDDKYPNRVDTDNI